MEEFSLQLFLAFIYGAVLLSLGVIVVYYVSDRRAERRKYRLKSALTTTHLDSVLSRLGISLSHFVQLNSVDDLTAQLHRCQTCAHHDACKRALEQNSQQVPITSCPNRMAIERYLANRSMMQHA